MSQVAMRATILTLGRFLRNRTETSLVILHLSMVFWGQSDSASCVDLPQTRTLTLHHQCSQWSFGWLGESQLSGCRLFGSYPVKQLREVISSEISRLTATDVYSPKVGAGRSLSQQRSYLVSCEGDVTSIGQN